MLYKQSVKVHRLITKLITIILKVLANHAL